MSQNAWVLEALKRGPISAMDALNGCGCFRLAARINDLRRHGHNIETKDLKLPNGKTVALYQLKEQA